MTGLWRVCAWVIAGTLMLAAHPSAPAGSECTADFDFDFDVDSTDLNILLLFFGCDAGPGGNCFGDINGDGAANSADLNILLNEFGTACGLGCGSFIAGDCCAANDTPFCERPDCCNTVCASDPLCCEVVWDDACATQAKQVCEPCIPTGACCLSRGGCLVLSADECGAFEGVFQGEDTVCSAVACSSVPECGVVGAGPCCATSSSPYCQDTECCESVCSSDPFCCSDAWDSDCVSAALDTCGFCAETTRWHVDYQNGDDASDGLSWGTAFASNTRLLESLDDYDVAYFRGQYRPDDPAVFEGFTGITLIGDPTFDFDGEGNPWVGRQAVLLDPLGWAEVFPGVHAQPITPGLPVQGVVQDWDATTLASLGFPDTHAGHLPEASNPLLEDGWWFYDEPNGALFVRTWEGGHPSGHEIEYLLDKHAIALISCSDCTLRGFAGKLAIRFGNGAFGYGIRGQSAVNCTIEDCRVYDTGDHCVGLAGPKCYNNLLRNVKAYGQEHAADGSRPSVMYVFASFDVDGGGDRAINCFGSPTPLLRPDGTPLRSMTKWKGQFALSHGGTGTTQLDTEYHGCVYDSRCLQVVNAEPWDNATNRQGFVSGAGTIEDVDLGVADTYPVRTYDSVILGAYQIGTSGTVAHTRLLASADLTSTSSSNAGLTFLNADTRLLLDYCAIVASVVAPGQVGNAVFRYKAGIDAEFRMRNTLLAVETESEFSTVGAQQNGAFFIGGGQAVLEADRCVFVRTGSAHADQGPYFAWLNGVDAAQNMDIADCWYAALLPGGQAGFFHSDPYAPGLELGGVSIESLADWQALIDSSGVYDTAPLLIGGWPITGLDPMLSEPAPESPLRTPRFKLDPRPGALGVNGAPDDGTIGPWQYGEPAP